MGAGIKTAELPEAPKFMREVEIHLILGKTEEGKPGLMAVGTRHMGGGLAEEIPPWQVMTLVTKALMLFIDANAPQTSPIRLAH